MMVMRKHRAEMHVSHFDCFVAVSEFLETFTFLGSMTNASIITSI